jgi:hypothetical protein
MITRHGSDPSGCLRTALFLTVLILSRNEPFGKSSWNVLAGTLYYYSTAQQKTLFSKTSN